MDTEVKIVKWDKHSKRTQGIKGQDPTTILHQAPSPHALLVLFQSGKGGENVPVTRTTQEVVTRHRTTTPQGTKGHTEEEDAWDENVDTTEEGRETKKFWMIQA